MSTQTAIELKYPALLAKHNLTEADIKGKPKETLGLLKAGNTRYLNAQRDGKPTDSYKNMVEKYDIIICNAIQDLVEVKLPEPPPTPEPTPDPIPEPVPTPEPIPEPVATKTTDEEHEEAVLTAINSHPEKYILYADLKKIIGTEPADPIQQVGKTKLRRQLHGKYYIYN